MANDWDRFRDEIVLLYLVEGLTLREVSSRMVQKHGFDKKKYQYEYVLKKWKISKNTKREMWEHVDHVVQKRHKQGKESQVEMGGMRLSDAHAKKAMQRYGRMSLAAKFRTVPSPRSPENGLISISTPPAPQDQMAWPEARPWVQFDNTFQMSNLRLSEPLMDSIVRTLATLSIDFSYPREVDLAISKALHESFNWRAAVNQTLPHLQDGEQGSIIPAHIQQPAITPAIALKSLLFRISNKQVNTDHTLLAQNMMQLIHALCREIPKAIGYIIGSTDPTSAAVKETFFSTATRFGQSSMVAKFLAAGTDPNALIDHTLDFEIKLRRGKALLERKREIRRITPLQLAAATCEIEVALALLEYGAKPDLGNPTPLQIVCSLPPSFDSVRLARILLQHRASLMTNQNHVLFPPLLEAVAAGNATMVQFLLGEGARDQIVDIYERDLGDCFYSGLIYRSNLFPASPCSPLFFQTAVPYTKEEKITALQIACIIDDISIVEMLVSTLGHCEDRTNIYRWALLTACLAADEDMVCRSLDAITDIREDTIWVNYALCAASWISDCRIARRLLKLGATPEWQETLEISAVQAAASYENADLIKLLHACGYDINDHHIKRGLQWDDRSWYKPPKYCQPLQCAIRVGSIQTVRVLLHLGARVTGNMIAVAIAHGSDDMIPELLARDADVNATLCRETPLEIALQEQKGLPLISKLVDAGAEPSVRALITAICNNDHVVSKYLLDSGVNILAPTTSKKTVLDAAAEASNMEIMREYFDCGGHYSSNALLLAAEMAVLHSDYSMVKYLWNRRPAGPMDTGENTLFVQSILENNCNLVELFLNSNIGSAMSHYCWHSWPGRLDESCEGLRLSPSAECKFMKSGGKEIDSCGRREDCFSRITPLWAAAHMQQKPLVDHLISSNHPPDAFLLESALYNPNFSSFEIRQQLIEAYPLSSIRDKSSCRRLLVAAINWNAGLVLMQQHINSIGSLDFVFHDCNNYKEKWTPLQLAVKYGNIEHVRLLLDAQANINEPAAGRYGRTALQMAAWAENLELTTFLLQRGADINAPGAMDRGRKALQLAVTRGNIRLAMLLLEHGADVNGPPSLNQGRTAIEIAAGLGLIDMAALLLPYVEFHGHMRIHFVRAVVFAEQNCHYATANYLKQGRWTEEDHNLSTKPQATEEHHVCPRILYNNQSWEGKCPPCNRPQEAWLDWGSSSEEESTTRSVVELTEFEEQATNASAIALADDLPLTEEQSEMLDADSALQSTDWSYRPSDTTARWLDDLVKEYFENLDGIWRED